MVFLWFPINKNTSDLRTVHPPPGGEEHQRAKGMRPLGQIPSSQTHLLKDNQHEDVWSKNAPMSIWFYMSTCIYIYEHIRSYIYICIYIGLYRYRYVTIHTYVSACVCGCTYIFASFVVRLKIWNPNTWWWIIIVSLLKTVINWWSTDIPYDDFQVDTRTILS